MVEPRTIDSVLTYPIGPFVNWPKLGTLDSMQVFPMDLCISDILLVIFQAVVDDEAAQCDPKAYDMLPRATGLLARVCRRWRDIIYDTPALWAVIYIDSSLYRTRERPNFAKSQRMRIQRAKGAPVDLYVFRFPTDWSSERYITSLLSAVPNLRKLHVDWELTSNWPMQSQKHPELLLSRAWSALQNLRELSYSGHFIGDPVNMAAHLAGMPKLSSLSIDSAALTLPYRLDHTSALLGRLKKLHLKGPVANMTLIFLSNCSSIEELNLDIPDNAFTYLGPVGFEGGISKLVLPHLAKLSSSGVVALKPFISTQIVTPTLFDLSLLMQYSERLGTPIRKLLELNAHTLTTLFLHVKDDVPFQLVLMPLIHLTTLSLIGVGHGAFLASLYESVNEESAKRSSPGTQILPSLRFLKLNIRWIPLSASHFSNFANARCIPASINSNGERITAAGYTALDNFALILVNPLSNNVLTVLSHAVNTPEWKVASVKIVNLCVIELWWDVR